MATNLPRVEFEITPNSFLAMAINAGHKVLFHTVLFGKEYVWLQDLDGTIYLERADPVG